MEHTLWSKRPICDVSCRDGGKNVIVVLSKCVSDFLYFDVMHYKINTKVVYTVFESTYRMSGFLVKEPVN